MFLIHYPIYFKQSYYHCTNIWIYSRFIIQHIASNPITIIITYVLEFWFNILQVIGLPHRYMIDFFIQHDASNPITTTWAYNDMFSILDSTELSWYEFKRIYTKIYKNKQIYTFTGKNISDIHLSNSLNIIKKLSLNDLMYIHLQ